MHVGMDAHGKMKVGVEHSHPDRFEHFFVGEQLVSAEAARGMKGARSMRFSVLGMEEVDKVLPGTASASMTLFGHSRARARVRACVSAQRVNALR